MSDPIFKFTDSTNKVVVRTWPSGRCESHSIEAGEYKAWLAAGNTPEPADPDPIPQPPKDLLDWFNDLSPARKGLFKDELKKP
jgi:hypothetical protein